MALTPVRTGRPTEAPVRRGAGRRTGGTLVATARAVPLRRGQCGGEATGQGEGSREPSCVAASGTLAIVPPSPRHHQLARWANPGGSPVQCNTAIWITRRTALTPPSQAGHGSSP